MRVFVDTTLWACRADHADPAKQARARSVLAATAHDLVTSTQVLVELFNFLTRRLTPRVDPGLATRVIDGLSALPVIASDLALVKAAMRTTERHQLAIWDALILEAAVVGGCEELWTEDLSTGATIRGVRIVNPLA